LKGLGYTLKMYDENGDGPLSSSYLAKYIYTNPDGLMFDLPTEDSSFVVQVVIYKSNDMNIDKFKKLFVRIKNIVRLYGVEVTVRSFDKHISPKDFAYKHRAAKEEAENNLEESIKKHLK